VRIFQGRLVGRSRHAACFALVLGAALSGVPAHAVLGERAATVGDDQARMKATRQTALAPSGASEMHEMTLADGSSIREYVNQAGVVFAVSWSTRLKPRLVPLLGQHAADYAAAAGAAAARPGIQRKISVQEGDLVVHSTAHLNAYVGVAYLRSLVPDGVQADALR
jgi:Protein of unknown function (DUF2844)